MVLTTMMWTRVLLKPSGYQKCRFLVRMRNLKFAPTLTIFSTRQILMLRLSATLWVQLLRMARGAQIHRLVWRAAHWAAGQSSCRRASVSKLNGYPGGCVTNAPSFTFHWLHLL